MLLLKIEAYVSVALIRGESRGCWNRARWVEGKGGPGCPRLPAPTPATASDTVVPPNLKFGSCCSAPPPTPPSQAGSSMGRFFPDTTLKGQEESYSPKGTACSLPGTLVPGRFHTVVLKSHMEMLRCPMCAHVLGEKHPQTHTAHLAPRNSEGNTSATQGAV